MFGDVLRGFHRAVVLDAGLRNGATPCGIGQLADVQAFHVAAFIKELQDEFSSPTFKQHLSVLRMVFDWL